MEHREVRFHHRKVFHDPYVFNRFDLVFFDCPPRLTTSTINALAACDYIVLPTSLHRNDVEAVPRTLVWLETLRPVDAFQARLLAVVLNRTFRKGTFSDALTRDEKLAFKGLEANVQQFLPAGGAVVKQLVPSNQDVAKFAAGDVPLGVREQGHKLYAGVAQELFQRMW